MLNRCGCIWGLLVILAAWVPILAGIAAYRAYRAEAEAHALPARAAAVALLPPTEADWLSVADVREAVAAPTLADIVRAEAERHGLDPALVAAVIEVESGGRPDAVNGASVGLMQVSPVAARAVGMAGADLTDPATNVRVGTAYLAAMVRRYPGDLHMALTSYNRGPAGAERWRERHGNGASTYSRRVMEATGR